MITTKVYENIHFSNSPFNERENKCTVYNATKIIEGGKILVELVRVFKTPKFAYVQQPVPPAEKKTVARLKTQAMSLQKTLDTSLYW